MNPSRTQTPFNLNPNLFKGLEALEFENPEPEITEVKYNDDDRKNIKESWDSFYNLKSESFEVVNEGPISRIETWESVKISEAAPLSSNENYLKPDLKPLFIIENQKSSSSLEEAGLKLDFPALGKEIGRGLFGALGIFKEIFMDTASLFIPKKEKKTEKPETDPEKAKAKAEKKAENTKKQFNIRAFFDGLRAQTSPAVSAEAVRIDSQEKSNINLSAKIGQESYKGIKDSFGRLTVYAASLFEKAQVEQEKKVKKQEKEMKIAAVKGGPDLNMDKVAEGGFLSSTGGQGAG